MFVKNAGFNGEFWPSPHPQTLRDVCWFALKLVCKTARVHFYDIQFLNWFVGIAWGLGVGWGH